MTQKSWPWAAPGVGDGSTELNEADSREFLAHLWVHDLTAEGVFKGLAGDLAGELEVAGTASPLTVQPGAAICYGLYMSDAEETLAVSTPAVDTTGFRVVLRTNWAGTSDGDVGEAQTRLAVVESADGVASIPALTQSFGTVWEISLATGTITTGGTITLTDDRTFRKATGITDTAELEDAAVTLAKLANAVTDQLVTGGDSHDHDGGDGTQIPTGGLGDNAVTNAKIADDSVDDSKAGDNIIQLNERQGGGASDWLPSGSTVFTPGASIGKAGSESWSGSAASGQVDITFDEAFSGSPLVFVNVYQYDGSDLPKFTAVNITSTGFRFLWESPGDAKTVVGFMWFALGPE